MGNIQDKALKIAKTTLITGYALSLIIPYRVEKHDGEITYHTPICKLGYKKATHEYEDGEKNIHTYTITTFGLLNDQISTLKRLYTAAILKKPYSAERAARRIKFAKDKAGCAVAYAKNGAYRTVRQLKKAKNAVVGLEDALVKFVEDIID